jgi:hypothetical protein
MKLIFSLVIIFLPNKMNTQREKFYYGLFNEKNESLSVYTSNKGYLDWKQNEILRKDIKEMCFAETFYKNVHFSYACEPAFRFSAGKTPLKEIRENFGFFLFIKCSYFIRSHSALDQNEDLFLHAFDETIRFFDLNIPMKLKQQRKFISEQTKWMIFFYKK